MGNKKSTSAGVSNYLRYVKSMPITAMNFQNVEKDFLENSLRDDTTFKYISEKDFINLCETNYLVDSTNIDLRNIHKQYFVSLYNDSKTSENDGTSVRIYIILLKLIPILKNNTIEKVKAFYRCIQNLHSGNLNGIELKNDYFEIYYKWNLMNAPNAINLNTTDQDEKDSLKNYVDKIGTVNNIKKVLNETLNLIAATDILLKGKVIVINDVYLIGDKIEYAFDLKKMLNEIWNRFRPEEE